MRKQYNAEYYLKQRTTRRVHKMFAKCKETALKKQFPISITKDWIREKIEAGFCELSGLPFDTSFDTGYTQNPYAPSVDKIDPKKGYVPENCRMVLWILNHAMSEYGIEKLINVVDAVKANIPTQS